MDNIPLYATIIILISFLTMSATYSHDVKPVTHLLGYTVVNAPMDLGFSMSPSDKYEVTVLIQGILNSKRKDKVWFQCGEKVPQAQWYAKAKEVAEVCVSTARMHGVDPVGQLATWQQESRLDPCAIGPGARNFAIRKGWLPKKRIISYKKEQVLAVLEHPVFKASFKTVDLGLAQLLYPWFTSGASQSEILSLEGAKASAQELARRGQRWKTDEPWITWPGKPSKARKVKIEWWVHTIMEIDFFEK